ncbi:anti-sigma-I factor RsgI2-like [Ambystoma mexicanum]|uniref:anti-sigma-I factor RsgI2-like n=1 Tax=Ambystoma mexicanum TaxID=8296 RepID=UPI0037E70CF0
MKHVEPSPMPSPSSSPTGSHTDSEEPATATQAPPAKKKPRAQETGDTTTKSRGKGRSEHVQRGKHRKGATAPIPQSTPATIATPTDVNPPTQVTPTEGPPSAATSSTGEAAATVPLSDVEDPSQVSMQMHTPTPSGSPEASPRPTTGSSIHGQSGEENTEGCWSPLVASPDVRDIEEGAAATP